MSITELVLKYKMLAGQELPVSKYGFSSPRDLLSSLSNAVDLCPTGPNPETDVLVRANRVRIAEWEKADKGGHKTPVGAYGESEFHNLYI